MSGVLDRNILMSKLRALQDYMHEPIFVRLEADETITVRYTNTNDAFVFVNLREETPFSFCKRVGRQIKKYKTWTGFVKGFIHEYKNKEPGEPSRGRVISHDK